jgi:hypothetical protein
MTKLDEIIQAIENDNVEMLKEALEGIDLYSIGLNNSIEDWELGEDNRKEAQYFLEESDSSWLRKRGKNPLITEYATYKGAINCLKYMVGQKEICPFPVTRELVYYLNANAEEMINFLKEQNLFPSENDVLSVVNKAIDERNYTAAKILIEEFKDNIGKQNLDNILCNAVFDQREALVDYLLELGITPAISEEYHPLIISLEGSYNPSIARMLLIKGKVDPNSKMIDEHYYDKKDTALTAYIAKDLYNLTNARLYKFTKDIELLDELIKYGADVNVANGKGLTPLQCALKSGYADVTKKLLQAGANIEPKSNLYHPVLNALLDLASLSDDIALGTFDPLTLEQIMKTLATDQITTKDIIDVINSRVDIQLQKPLTKFSVYELYRNILYFKTTIDAIKDSDLKEVIGSRLKQSIPVALNKMVENGVFSTVNINWSIMSGNEGKALNQLKQINKAPIKSDALSVFSYSVEESFNQGIIDKSTYNKLNDHFFSNDNLSGLIFNDILDLPYDNAAIANINNEYAEHYKMLYSWFVGNTSYQIKKLMEEKYNEYSSGEQFDQLWKSFMYLASLEFKWDSKLVDSLIQMDMVKEIPSEMGELKSKEENILATKKALMFHSIYPNYHSNIELILERPEYLEACKEYCLNEPNPAVTTKKFIELVSNVVLSQAVKESLKNIVKEVESARPDLFTKEDFASHKRPLETDGMEEGEGSSKKAKVEEYKKEESELSYSETNDVSIIDTELAGVDQY